MSSRRTEEEINKYLKYFHDMVTMGICTGLQTPQEWIVQYARCIGQPHTEIKNIQNFCDEASAEFCGLDIQKDSGNVTEKDLQQWFDSVYKKNTGLRLVPFEQEQEKEKDI